MPPELAVHVALFTNVQNASFLRDQLLTGNTQFEYALIDASMILSTRHILAATFRAMNDYLSERLKSRNIHSEIVFCLSNNNNILEAFKKFGVSESTTSLIVVKVSIDPNVTHESIAAHLQEAIEGNPVPFEDSSFKGISDVSKIAKAYKISATQQANGKSMSAPPMQGDKGGYAPDGRRELEVSILGLMALRGAT